jgi:hypothetical protein
MGKKSGKESQTFMNALKYLAEAKTNIKEIMYLLPRYARYKNEVALNDVRKLFIEEMGLLFTLYQKGYYERKEIYKSLSIEQKKALEDVKKIKITKLQPSDLLSEHSKSKSKHYDPLYLGKDERTDARQSSITMAITKSILPIITSYFAIQVVLGSSILWGAIQVAVIMLMGVTHYMEGEDYIVSELKNRQINKADLLIEFKNLYDNSHQIFQEEIKILEELEKEEQKSSPPIIESGEMPLQLKEA